MNRTLGVLPTVAPNSHPQVRREHLPGKLRGEASVISMHDPEPVLRRSPDHHPLGS